MIIQPLYRQATGSQAGTYFDMGATDTVAPIALSINDIQAYSGPMQTLLCVDNRVFDKVTSSKQADNVTVLSVNGDNSKRWIWRLAYREPLTRWGLIEGQDIGPDGLSKNNARFLSALDSGERLHAPGLIYEFDNEMVLTGVPVDLTGNAGKTRLVGRHDGAIIKLDNQYGASQPLLLADIGYSSLASGSSYMVHCTNGDDLRLMNIQSDGITFRSKILYADTASRISLSSITASNNTVAYFKDCDGIDINGIHAVSTENPWNNGWYQNDQMAVVNLRWTKNVVASNMYFEGYVHGFEMWGSPDRPGTDPMVGLDQPYYTKNIHVTGLWAKNQRMSAFWGFSIENVTLDGFGFENCGDVGPDFERGLNCTAQNGWVKDCGGYTGGANLAVFWISKGITFRNIKSIISEVVPHPDPMNQVPEGQNKYAHCFLPSVYSASDFSAEDITFDNCTFETASGNEYMIRFHAPRKKVTVQNCSFINTYNNTHICATYELVVDNNTHVYNNDSSENMIALLAMAGKPHNGLPGRVQITRNRIFFKQGIAAGKERIGIIAFSSYTEGTQQIDIRENEVYGATTDLITKRLFDDSSDDFVTPTLSTAPVFSIQDNILPTGTWLREEQPGYVASTVIWERNRKGDGTLFWPDKVADNLVRLTKNSYSDDTRYYYIGSLLADDNPNSFARAYFTLHGSTDADTPYLATFSPKSRGSYEMQWKLERVSALSQISASVLVYAGVTDPDSQDTPTKKKFFDIWVKVPAGFNDVVIEQHMWWDWRQTGNKRAYDEQTTAPVGSPLYDSSLTQPYNWIRSEESDALGGRGIAVVSASGTKYYLLGSLPLTTSDTNYSQVRILANVGVWASSSRTEIDLRAGSKDGFTGKYRKRGVANTSDGIVAYNNEGVIDLYLVLSGTYKQGLVSTLYKQGFTGLPQDLQAKESTTTPDGSKCFDSRDEATYPQAIEDTFLTPIVTLLPPALGSFPASPLSAGITFNASNGLVDVGVVYAGSLYRLDYDPIVSSSIDSTIVPMFWDTVNKKRRYTALATLKAALDALP